MLASASLIGLTWKRMESGSGFTLVEVLVALALLGLISVILFSSFKFGVRAWEAGNARVDQIDQVEVVQTLVRDELNEASQLSLPSGAPGSEFIFAGSADELRFGGSLPAHLGMGGAYVLVLSSTGAGRDRSLTLRWRVYRPDMLIDDEGWSDPVALLAGIEDIHIEYFGAAEDEERSTWRDFWKDQERLPELIRLRVIFPHADPRWWPELLVAPKVQRMGVAQ